MEAKLFDNSPYWKALQQLDAVARNMEIKWGVGRLELLVASDLREKFTRQEGKLNDALQEGRHADVVALAAGMARGWEALDKAAVSAGHSPPAVGYWEVVRGGKLYRVVKSSVEASLASVQAFSMSL